MMLSIIAMVFQFIGALSFLLFGMSMMSEGIQKSAGNSLRRVLRFVTGNRVSAVLLGMFVTCVIQSSSATTVMIVSFVNSGLLTLTQAIGTIFGANIGTTLTAWIVSLFGFKFKIAAFAIPVFGVGFLLAAFKRLRKKDIGQALMGFGLLFLGLEWLGDTIPKLDPETINAFLSRFSGSGVKNMVIGILAGTIITVILDSSSAVTALIITMAHSGLLTWEFSCARAYLYASAGQQHWYHHRCVVRVPRREKQRETRGLCPCVFQYRGLNNSCLYVQVFCPVR
jgi:phosphate:Na+ symporter